MNERDTWLTSSIAALRRHRVAFFMPRSKHRRRFARCSAVAVLCMLAALPLRVFSSLDEARRLATDGQIEQALKHVDEMLVLQPDNVAARLLRGVLLSRDGQSDAAIDTFLAIAEDRPDLPEPHNNLAVLYAAQGRYDDARGALKRAIALQPDYDVAHENLGDVYVKLAALAYSRAERINEANERAAQKAAATERLLNVLQPRAPARRQDTADNTTASRNAHKTGAAAPTDTTKRTPPAVTSADAAIATSPQSTAERCLQIPTITPAARAGDIVQWLNAHGMRALIAGSSSNAKTTSRYRVLLPPQGDSAQARAQLAQLRAKGITDLIIISRGEHANGISLGVFSKRTGAERRQRALASKGVHTQIVENITTSQVDAASVRARGSFMEAQFAREFADINFEIIDCR